MKRRRPRCVDQTVVIGDQSFEVVTNFQRSRQMQRIK